MKAQIFRSEITKVLSKLSPSSQFVTIRGYKNNYGGKADYSLVFHINYSNAVRKSFFILNNYHPKLFDCIGFSLDDLIQAKEELQTSYLDTLSALKIGGFNKNYLHAETYCSIKNDQGMILPGIKLYKKQDFLHMEGFIVWKKVIIPDFSKSLKLSAKNYLRSKTPLSKFVQFKLSPGRFDSLTIGKITLDQFDCLRKIDSAVEMVA